MKIELRLPFCTCGRETKPVSRKIARGPARPEAPWRIGGISSAARVRLDRSSSSVWLPNTWNTRSRMVATGVTAAVRRAACTAESLLRMRQAVVRHKRRDMRQFRLLRPQELLARRNVEEQVAHRNDGASAQRDFVATQHLAAGDFDARAGGLLRRTRFEQQAGNRRDGRQRLAAKPSVAIESRSFTSRSLLVAWRSKASSASSRSMPQPSL